jgi:predicted dehydrogenase
MWYHFGAGEMGNDGVHDVDYTRWALGVATHPNRVSAEGGKYFQTDETEFPDTQQVAFEYASPTMPGGKQMLIYEQRLWSVNYPYNVDSGAEFYGTKGMMFLSRRGKIQVWDDKKAPVETGITLGGQNDVLHVKNLCDAIRGEAKLNADALTGHLTTSLVHLGNIATRLGRSLKFDPQMEQFVNDDEANRLTRREYREHWATPKGV